MKLKKIAEILEAKIVCGEEHLETEIPMAFASDLMSDVLTLENNNFLLITGLANLQTIRTCEMADIQYILFVRNKKATPEMIELADENGIILVESEYSLYKASGLLYMNGLEPVY